jgi:hypothetical protein
MTDANVFKAKAFDGRTTRDAFNPKRFDETTARDDFGTKSFDERPLPTGTASIRLENGHSLVDLWTERAGVGTDVEACQWPDGCPDELDRRLGQLRLQLFGQAYNLGDFLMHVVLPQAARHWTLTTLREN